MYFITAFSNVDFDNPVQYYRSRKRCFGYFRNKDDAIEAVKENQCDMHECLYDYIVIEKIEEGIQGWCNEVAWFKYNLATESWLEIEKPKSTNGVIHHAIG